MLYMFSFQNSCLLYALEVNQQVVSITDILNGICFFFIQPSLFKYSKRSTKRTKMSDVVFYRMALIPKNSFISKLFRIWAKRVLPWRTLDFLFQTIFVFVLWVNKTKNKIGEKQTVKTFTVLAEYGIEEHELFRENGPSRWKKHFIDYRYIWWNFQLFSIFFYFIKRFSVYIQQNGERIFIV